MQFCVNSPTASIFLNERTIECPSVACTAGGDYAQGASLCVYRTRASSVHTGPAGASECVSPVLLYVAVNGQLASAIQVSNGTFNYYCERLPRPPGRSLHWAR